MTYSMEPMMPPEGEKELEDLAFTLSAKANTLTASINPIFTKSMAHLVKSMNCYYSNLIEGHNTHPRDIDRALNQDYESLPEKRNLQLEARAHIEVQELIHTLPKETSLVSTNFLIWLHKEFCSRLPGELLKIVNPITGTTVKVIPGELRKSGVQIGRHIPPTAEELPIYLKRFSEAYNPSNFSKIQQIIAVAASHHRLLWIHPFYDGNGRVARLFSDTFMKSIGVGNDLWSISRGLARTVQDYKKYLTAADMPRLGDLDGGNLSQKGLTSFCSYFLKTCIDQVEFMDKLFDLKTFLFRLEQICEQYRLKGKLLPGSFPILRELYFVGEIERGKIPSITGYKERQSRSILTLLIKEKLVISDTPKGKIRLNFPLEIAGDLFPQLFPI
jgi:Fic family protein